jgi:hypothetical protein
MFDFMDFASDFYSHWRLAESWHMHMAEGEPFFIARSRLEIACI